MTMSANALRPIRLTSYIFLAALCLVGNSALALPPIDSGPITLVCGTNSEQGSWQIRGPAFSAGPRDWVLAFSGTPGISFFSAQTPAAGALDQRP